MNSSLQDATQVMRQLPVSAMLSSIEMQIDILQERGIEIRDWENRDRVLKQVRIIGGKAYFLATGEKENKN
jgi:Mor family transcriptional regulator